MLLQYRAAAIAGIWTQFFFGIVLIMIYEAFIRASRSPSPMSLTQIVSYVWLGQALLGMLPWNADAEVRAMVRSGAVAYELCRPIDLYSLWYMRAIALRSAPTMLRAVPMVLIASLGLPLIGLSEWQLRPPPTFASAVAFAGALVGALLLGCALTALINISLMWTISGDGFVMLMTAAVSFLSGMIIPLPMFPDWARTLVEWSPFAGLVDLPFRVYTGHIAPADVPLVLFRQMIWTGMIVLLGRWLLARGMRAIAVQGG
jgi:ABC-2 type transport system permease protein